VEKNGINGLFRAGIGKLNTRTGKVAALLVLAVLMAAASASVFVMYYGNATATVRAPDVTLVAGSDTGGSTYPSTTVTVAATKDFATIGMSWFPSATNSPQPATYFSDLLQVKNVGTSGHTISQITISGITDTNSALGKIVIYYCTSQTNDPASSNVGHFDITTTTGGTLLSSGQAIAASGTHYIEIVAYAASGAVAPNAVTFAIGIQWT